MNKRQDPFEISLLVAFTVTCILSLIDSVNGPEVISFALESRAWIWYSSLLVASVLSLYGAYSKKFVRGLLVERLGVTWIAAIFFTYTIGLIFTEHRAITPIVISLFVSIAAVTRAVQITIDLKKLVKG